MAIELELVECLQELVAEFDRNYSDIAEVNRGHYNSFFGQVVLCRPCILCPLDILKECPALFKHMLCGSLGVIQTPAVLRA
eukprot:scaffold23316_cov51-Prasinocladus_malaysianus.AAC.2